MSDWSNMPGGSRSGFLDHCFDLLDDRGRVMIPADLLDEPLVIPTQETAHLFSEMLDRSGIRWAYYPFPESTEMMFCELDHPINQDTRELDRTFLGES